MEAKTQNGGLYFLVLYWRAGRIHKVKDNGSGWLRWLLNKGGIILVHPNHRDNSCTLELSFDYSPPIQTNLELVNISEESRSR
jgi:hypothetical protein